MYLDGFLIDDIAVPELDLFDDAEGDHGWQAEGFLRTDNTLPQDYLVQVIEERADGTVSVRDLALDQSRNGQILIQGFGSGLDHAVILVSPVTRGTHQPAQYILSVSPRP